MTAPQHRYRTAVWLCATLLLGAATDEFRYEAPVTAAPGFSVLELPAEVLSAAAPDLRDIRLLASGKEVAYAVESHIAVPNQRLPLIDVESMPAQDTRALADRGQSPGVIEALTLEVSNPRPFMKAIVVEAADDPLNFREIARGSVFRTASTAALRVNFAPTDRRYLRIRLDDRLSEAVTPTAVLLDGVPIAKAKAHEYPVQLEPRGATEEPTAGYAVDLGRTNLAASSMSFEVKDPVFSRQVRIFQRILWRDELSLRLVGEGRIERLATGSESLTIPLAELRGARLEVEVEDAGSPLEFLGARIRVEPKRIVFYAPQAGSLLLMYGSLGAPAAHYDLETVLSRGMPKAAAIASLGPVTDRGARAPLPNLPRGPKLQGLPFKSHRAVILPKEGSIAYLDLPGVTPEAAHRVRLLASEGSQVPFIVESASIRSKVPLKLAVQNSGPRTTATITGFASQEPPVALELTASAPAVFRRELKIFENERDQRGPLGRRPLGTAQWERRPGTGPEASDARLAVEITPPQTNAVLVEIHNGENPPLTLTEVHGSVSRARIDFAFVPGESLTLLTDNPDAAPAHYDLELLSERLLASPALAATLAPVALRDPSSGRELRRPVWFWIAFLAAAGLLLAVLRRVLRPEARRPS